MSDDLNLPPKRRMPPRVRHRLRARLQLDMSVPAPGRLARYRAPLAAAAAVAVLAVGATISVRMVEDLGNSPGDGQPTTSNANRAWGGENPAIDLGTPRDGEAELNRCWEAIRLAGKVAQFPPRSEWRLLASYGVEQQTSTMARAAGKPLFCETTPTTVTVSDPNATPVYAEGSRNGTLLVTELGMIAGVVDPSWDSMGLLGLNAAGRLPTFDNLFMYFARDRGFDSKSPYQVTKVDASGWPISETARALPTGPPPAVSIVDRPTEADRSSERGQLLDECIDKSTSAVVDAASWEPGAMVSLGDEWLIVTRNEHGVSFCGRVLEPPGEPSAKPRPRFVFGRGSSVGYAIDTEQVEPTEQPIASRFSEDLGTNTPDDRHHWALIGTLPDEAARMEIRLAGATVLHPDVANGTFAVLIPVSGPESYDTWRLKARVWDESGNLIYQGDLAPPFDR